jgi:hypothetical protein
MMVKMALWVVKQIAYHKGGDYDYDDGIMSRRRKL